MASSRAHSANTPWCLLYLLALCFIAEQESLAAGSDFDKLMEKAEHLKKTRNNQAALPLYEQLTRQRPGNSQAHAGLGWVLFELGQKDAGLKEERKAISLDPKNADAHHHLGAMYLALNRTDDAADEFEKALRIDPGKECSCGPVDALIKARHRKAAESQ